MVVSLLELILRKKILIFYELSMKYLDILNNQLKTLITLINKISTRLLQLKFKSDNTTKWKAIKCIAKENIAWLSVIMETYCVSCKKIYCKQEFRC